MTTYPLPTLAPTIDAFGISAPSYADILASMEASVEAIYGSDIELGPSTQDGEFLAVLASAQNDTNNAIIAAYNAYAPTTAQGTGLSNSVKINGLQREVATNSQAVETIVGVAGTTITNGIIGDNQNLNTQWSLPASVTIPPAGTIDVTVTCTQVGSTLAAPGTLTQILTPTRGWQTGSNATSATPGNPVEDDAVLRQRQSQSVALPALSVYGGLIGQLSNLPGVSRLQGYENDTSITDSDGLPPHSISVVIQGGDVTQIAQTILNEKGPGCDTYGTTTETVDDTFGTPYEINFFELALTTVYVIVNIKAFAGYLSTTGDTVVAALVQSLLNLEIGEDVYYARLFSPANLSGTAAIQAATALAGSAVTQAQLDVLSNTYEILSIYSDVTPSPAGTADIDIAFNFAASADNTTVILNVIP